MINPYRQIKELENQLSGCGKEIHKLNLEIKELKGIPKTSIHPQYKGLINEVKEINGRMLHQFTSLLDMPHNRYNSCMRFSTEVNMRVDADILSKSIEDCLKFADEGKISKLIGILILLQEHTKMLISIEASYRLASCVYFWKEENLDEYDYEIGDEKIKLFKEIGLESFFLSKPMNNFLPPLTISADVLKACSHYEKELKSLLSNQLRKESD